MNWKMDTILATLQRPNASVVNILREEHLEEEEGETSTVGDVQATDDRMTYETPNTEVHSEVFVDGHWVTLYWRSFLQYLGRRLKPGSVHLHCYPRSLPARDLRRGRTRFVSIPFGHGSFTDGGSHAVGFEQGGTESNLGWHFQFIARLLPDTHSGRRMA